MLKCRCRACDTTFLDGGGATRCPGCGKKGKLEPIAVQGGPPMEAQLAQWSAFAGAGQAVMSATLHRNPLRKAASVTLIVAASLALFSSLMYVLYLAAVLDNEWGAAPDAVVHAVGATVAVGGVAGLLGAVMHLQGHPSGRMVSSGAAAVLLGSISFLFIDSGGAILWFGWFLGTVGMWLCALASLILNALPDRPIASSAVTVSAVGPIEQ